MIAMKIEKAKSVSGMNSKGGFEYRGGDAPNYIIAEIQPGNDGLKFGLIMKFGLMKYEVWYHYMKFVWKLE